MGTGSIGGERPAAGTARARRGTVYVVLPGDIDDTTAPSGGNRYDRRVCQELAAEWSVRELAVPGAWPSPGTAERAALAGALAGVPDGAVVLLDGLVACAAPEVVVPEARRLRLVVLVHLPLADETGLSPDAAAELDALERRTLRAATAVVATSAWTGRRLVDHHDLPPTGVHVAPPGADPAPLAPGTDGASRLACVAAVTPRKGHDVLAEALATVADLPWDCVCVGGLEHDAEHVGRLRWLAGDLGIGDRMRLVGPRTGDALEATYAAADLVVLASRAEPYGMVVTEALARGIPVLATAVDGLPEALGRAPDGGLPGMLVPAGDPVALGAALRRWLDEPGLRERLRAAARARRGALGDWRTTARRLTEVLTSSAVPGFPPAPPEPAPAPEPATAASPSPASPAPGGVR